MQSASKVGALVLVFIGLLYGAYAVVGRNWFEPKTDIYYAEMADAGGIAVGTRVLLHGVNVGQVSAVGLAPAGAQLTLKLTAGTPVPVGSKVLLPTSLIGIGSNPVQLILPPPGSTTVLIAPGDKTHPLSGEIASPLSALGPGAETTLGSLNKTLDASTRVLKDLDQKNEIESLLKSTNASMVKIGTLADNLAVLSRQTSGVVVDNQTSIHDAIRSAALAMADIQVSTKMLAQLMVQGHVGDKTKALLGDLDQTVKRADGLVADLDQFVTDPKLRKPLNETVQNMADITSTGKSIAANTEEITKNGITISEKAIDIANKADNIAGQASGLVTKVDSFFSKPSHPFPQIHFEMDELHQSNPDRWRTDVEASTALASNLYFLGVYDAFESNKIIAEVGKPMNRGYYRYGIYASKPGFGVQYALTPRLGFRSDLFDINDPKLNFRFSYQVRDGVEGWLGMDELFHKNTPSFGIGVFK